MLCGRGLGGAPFRRTMANDQRPPSRRTFSTGSSRRTSRTEKWIADFTYVWTAEGWLYVAAVIDLFSRRVVGWSMKAEMTSQLVTDALMMAIWRRGKPDALLHHSDSERIRGQFSGGLTLTAIGPFGRLALQGSRCGLTRTPIDQSCLSPDLSVARKPCGEGSPRRCL